MLRRVSERQYEVEQRSSCIQNATERVRAVMMMQSLAGVPRAVGVTAMTDEKVPAEVVKAIRVLHNHRGLLFQ